MFLGRQKGCKLYRKNVSMMEKSEEESGLRIKIESKSLGGLK